VADAKTVASDASTGASIGSVVPGVGTAIGAAAGALVGLLTSGSGKQTAEQKFQGYQVTGSLGPTGFFGAVKGAFSDGVYDATGETSYINSLGKGLFTSTYGGQDLAQADIDRYFADNGPLSVSFNAGSSNTGIARTVSNLAADAIRSYTSTRTLLDQLTKPSAMDAPTISSTTQPSGMPITQPNTAAAVASDANTVASQLVSFVTANPLLLVLLLGGALWLAHKKG
jgi:hypothetical protein